MDNASTHYLERIEEIIIGVGAKILFLPPYSPDLTPLEEAFAKVKSNVHNNINVKFVCENGILLYFKH